MIYNKIFSLIYGVETAVNPQSLNTNLITKTYKPSKNLQSPIFIAFLTNPTNTTGNYQMLENLFHQKNLSSY